MAPRRPLETLALTGVGIPLTVIGTAGNTITRLGLPAAETERLLNNIPVAYAVSYLVGTTLVIWFISTLAPRLMRVDLKAESRKLEAAGATKEEAATRSAYREWDVRAFEVPGSWIGRSVSAIEASFAPARVFLQRLRRGSEVREPEPSTALEAGDRVVVGARRNVLLAEGWPFGKETEDRELLDFPMATLDVVVTRREVSDRTGEVAGNFKGALDKSVKDQPMATLALAAAVGFVLGALWKS